MSYLRPRVVLPQTSKAVNESLPRHAGDPAPQPDNYFSQVVKYIPAEAITAYQGIAGLVSSTNAATPDPKQFFWLQVTGIACLIFTPIWLLFATKGEKDPPAWSQAIVGFLAFAVWLLAINSPALELLQIKNWNQFNGSVVLILSSTLVFPLLGRIFAKLFGS